MALGVRGCQIADYRWKGSAVFQKWQSPFVRRVLQGGCVLAHLPLKPKTRHRWPNRHHPPQVYELPFITQSQTFITPALRSKDPPKPLRYEPPFSWLANATPNPLIAMSPCTHPFWRPVRATDVNLLGLMAVADVWQIGCGVPWDERGLIALALGLLGQAAREFLSKGIGCLKSVPWHISS